MTTLTLTDAAGTPVNRSYPLVQANPDLAVWKDFSTNGNTAAGAGVASISVKETPTAIRITARLIVPTMESISGDDGGYVAIPQVAFSCLGNLDLVYPNRASLQNRKDHWAMLKDLFGDALMTSAVENFVHVS